MFSWLFEGHLLVYVLLGAAAVGLLALWYLDRKRHWLYGVAAVAALVALYALLDVFVETDREQITTRLRVMAKAFGDRDTAALFEHVADSYSGYGGTKATAREEAKAYMPRIREIVVWDFDFDGTPDPAKEYAGLRFGIKFRGDALGNYGDIPYQCRPVFVKDPAKGWQLKSFKLYEPGRDVEIVIPGVPRG